VNTIEAPFGLGVGVIDNNKRRLTACIFLPIDGRAFRMSSEKIATLIGDLDTSSDKTAEKVIKKLMDFKTAAVPHL